MRKVLFIPAIIFLLFACNSSSTHKTLADSLHVADTALKHILPQKMIVPGKRIGMLYINEDMDTLINNAGKWQHTENVTGGALLTYYTKHNKTIYTSTVYVHTNKDSSLSGPVKMIRVTSPSFKTTDYAGAGSMLKDVKKLYKLKRHPAAGSKKLWLYDDYNAGIAFEVDSTQRCISVMVHAKGDSTLTAIDMHR